MARAKERGEKITHVVERKLAEYLAETEAELWWMSFADDGGWLGAVIGPAAGWSEALTEASLRGLNPGGEVAFYGPLPSGAVAADLHWRLLGRSEVEGLPEPTPA
jgi:hypothetical protein